MWNVLSKKKRGNAAEALHGGNSTAHLYLDPLCGEKVYGKQILFTGIAYL